MEGPSRYSHSKMRLPSKPYKRTIRSVRDGKSEEHELIARLKAEAQGLTPVTEISELKTESDVEQKLPYQFLCHPSFFRTSI
jgi:hypothetical protein